MKLSIKAIILLFIAFFAVVSAVSRKHKRSLRHKVLSQEALCKKCHDFANFASCYYYSKEGATICDTLFNTYVCASRNGEFTKIESSKADGIKKMIKSGQLKEIK